MKIAHVDWQIVYASTGIPTIMCLIYDEEGFCFSAVGAGLQDCGESDRNDALFNAIALFKRYIEPLFIEYNDPLLFDEFLSNLDCERYTVDGIMASSVAYHRWCASNNEMSLYELCAVVADNDFFSVPMTLFTIMNMKDCSELPVLIDFFIIPIEVFSYADALRVALSVCHEFKKLDNKISKSSTFLQRLFLLKCALKKVNKKYGYECMIGIDMHADQRFSLDQDAYFFEGNLVCREALLDIYMVALSRYPIIAWHNPFASTDSEGWALWQKALCGVSKNDGIQLGIDTSKNIIMSDKNIYNALLIDDAHATTLTSILARIHESRSTGKRAAIKCHMRNAYDPWMIDVAVGMSVDQIIFDDFINTIQFVACNHLLTIERELKE